MKKPNFHSARANKGHPKRAARRARALERQQAIKTCPLHVLQVDRDCPACRDLNHTTEEQ